jgi:hypothetical protein
MIMRNYFPDNRDYIDPAQKRLRPMFDLQAPSAPGLDWAGHPANQDYSGEGGEQQQSDPYDLAEVFTPKKDTWNDGKLTGTDFTGDQWKEVAATGGNTTALAEGAGRSSLGAMAGEAATGAGKAAGAIEAAAGMFA